MRGHRRNRKYDGKKLTWLRDAKWFALAIVVLFAVFRLVIGIALVDGESMMPTLKNGQPVVYNRMVGQYFVGDIVSVRMPGGAYYVKRVVAIEGDVVDIRDGALYVNGELRSEHAVGTTDVQSNMLYYPCRIPEGEVFVLGDNREASVDSRTFGPVALSQIRGRLLNTYTD